MAKYDMFEGDRVGPKMRAAVMAVSRREYQSRNELAIHVGPNRSQDYGYRIVNRCVRAGLLAVDSSKPYANPKGRGAPVVTEKGERYLEEVSADV